MGLLGNCNLFILEFEQCISVDLQQCQNTDNIVSLLLVNIPTCMKQQQIEIKSWNQ